MTPTWILLPLLFAPALLHCAVPSTHACHQDTCWAPPTPSAKQLFCGSPQTSDNRSGGGPGSGPRILWGIPGPVTQSWSEACCQTQSPTCDHGVLADTCYTWKHTLDWSWKVKNVKYLFNITILVTCWNDISYIGIKYIINNYRLYQSIICSFAHFFF